MAYSAAAIITQAVGVDVAYGLVWAPTALSGSVPYYTGGTLLGYTTEGAILAYKQEWVEIRGDESGKELLDLRYAGTDLSFTATLMETSDATLQRMFPGGLTSTGGVSGVKNVEWPGTLKLGTSGRDHAGVLLFVPASAATVGKIVIMRNAIPRAQEAAQMAMQLRKSLAHAVAFHGTQDRSIASSNARYNSRNTFFGNFLDTSI